MKHYILLFLLAMFSVVAPAQIVYTFQNGEFDDGSGADQYANNIDQGYLIQPYGNFKIQINFTSFDLEPGCDYVYVYDGPDIFSPLIGMYDNNNPPPAVITSTGTSLYIRFTTDESVTYGGWSLSYVSIVLPGSNNFIYTDPKGSFDDGSGPNNYANSLDNLYVIKPLGASRVKLNFTSFAMEAYYDFIYVYDGQNTACTVLGKYSNNALPPSEIVSSGNSMCIRFVTDPSVTYSGWSVNYSSILDSPASIYPDKDVPMLNNTLPGYNTSTNYGTSTLFFAEAGTNYGYLHWWRSLIGFDLSGLPSNAIIQNATLYLYSDGKHTSSFMGSPYLSNACWLRRTTGTWSETGTTWINQPGVTTVNQVSIPASTSASQNYAANITNILNDIRNNPGQGDGLMLMLQNESKYCRMSFFSREYSDVTKRPKLVVTYSLAGLLLSMTIPVRTDYIQTDPVTR